MKIVYPDNELVNLKIELKQRPVFRIFLAGTIDNGNSVDWQKELIDMCEKNDNELSKYLNIFNPRRAHWSKNADKEELENQIRWEQDHLDEADLIVMVLSDNSKSPISLLELGLYAESGKLIVFCTDKFYRFDNVRLTCEKYFIPLVQSTKTKDIYDNIKSIIG